MSYKVDPRETSFFQPAVEDKDLTSPPAYSKGKRYIIGVGATGDWNTKDNYITDDNGAGWDFITPTEGMIVYIKDEDKFYKYISSWTEVLPAITYSKSFVISNPTSSSDSPLWRVPYNITITAIHVLCIGAAIVGQLIQYNSNGGGAGTTVGADITGIVNTNVDNGDLTGAIITAGNYLGWNTTSATTGANRAIISFDYQID
jgi:hypothetical protein